MIYVLDLPKDMPGDAAEAKQRIQELAKCCRKIMADGTVSDAELTALRQWITEAGWLRRYWPAGALGSRILDVLEPTNSDKKARQELGRLLSEIAEGLTEEDCATDYDEAARIVYKDQFGTPRKFCFTGIFFFGTRAKCWDAIHARGGATIENVSGRIDYLVVGGVCSPRWLNAASGTKLEAARNLRRTYEEQRRAAKTKEERQALHRPPKIISERTWVELLPRLAEFREGRAIGYAMFVPPVFKSALEAYDFAAGDTLYDVDTTAEVWSDAAGNVGVAVQVVSATPGAEGQLRYLVYRPNEKRTKLVRGASVTVTQEEFNSRLRTRLFDQQLVRPD